MLYWDAMDRYGSDKPDLRVTLELCDVASVFAKASFEPFKQVLNGGGVVRALALPGGAALSRKELMDLEDRAKKFGASGLAAFQMKEGALKGPLVKFLTEGELEELCRIANLKDGDALFVLADASRARACTIQIGRAHV